MWLTKAGKIPKKIERQVTKYVKLLLEVLFYCGINKFEDFSLQGGNPGCKEITRVEFPVNSSVDRQSKRPGTKSKSISLYKGKFVGAWCVKN